MSGNEEYASRLLAENLSVWIGRRKIVRDVGFCLDPGITAVLGENGAGKTTLLKGILKLGLRQEGEILLKPGRKGTPVDLVQMSHRIRARYLAYVPQDLHPGFRCTVRDFAVMGRTPYLKFLETPGRADYRRAKEALEELQISHLAHRNLDQISGGERKLAYLARARVQEARWMLLDEPMAGLDFGRQHRFFETLQACVERSIDGAVVTIHDPLMAWRYCSQILVMKEGKLQASLKKEEPDFEERYLEQMELLYGMKAVFADTPQGRTIIWRNKNRAENQGLCKG